MHRRVQISASWNFRFEQNPLSPTYSQGWLTHVYRTRPVCVTVIWKVLRRGFCGPRVYVRVRAHIRVLWIYIGHLNVHVVATTPWRLDGRLGWDFIPGKINYYFPLQVTSTNIFNTSVYMVIHQRLIWIHL